MDETIKLEIDSYEDRLKMVGIMAKNGYKVTIKETKEFATMKTTYYVVFWLNKGDLDGE